MKIKFLCALFLTLSLSIPSMAQRNTVGMNASGERFSHIYNATHSASFWYKRDTPFGSAFARLNYFNRFKLKGLQYEFDGYPVIVHGTYLYLNYGYSASTLFPQNRAGLELFQSLPASFEVSFGVRHMHFHPGIDVTSYTASVGYYRGNYYCALRTFATPGSGGTSRSLNLNLRKYFSDADEFAFVRFSGGVSPDEQSAQSGLGSRVYNLASQSASAGWQSGFINDLLFDVQVGWSNQELISSPGSFVRSYSLLLGFRLRF